MSLLSDNEPVFFVVYYYESRGAFCVDNPISFDVKIIIPSNQVPHLSDTIYLFLSGSRPAENHESPEGFPITASIKLSKSNQYEYTGTANGIKYQKEGTFNAVLKDGQAEWGQFPIITIEARSILQNYILKKWGIYATIISVILKFSLDILQLIHRTENEEKTKDSNKSQPWIS